MKRIIKRAALLVLILLLGIVYYHNTMPLVYAYSGTSNITAASVNDDRVDPSDSVTWTVGPILNGTENPIQNGWGMDFDGIIDYLNIPWDASQNVTSFTFMMWIKSNVASQRFMASAYVAHTDGFYVGQGYPWNDGTDWWYRSAGAGGYTQGMFGSVTVGQWTHLTIIQNSTWVRGYLNGSQVFSIALTDEIDWSPIRNLRIGYNWYSVYGQGEIDEVLWYNRTIGTGELSYYLDNGVPLNQTGLIMWLDLDWNTLDQSPTGNDATKNGDPEYVRGIRGKAALTFDGVGDYVEISDDPSLDIIDALTISVWFKWEEQLDGVPTRYYDLVGKGHNLYRIRIRDEVGTHQMFLDLWIDGVRRLLYGNTQLQTGQWYNIIGTYDGEYLRIYLNGVPDSTPLAASGSIDTSGLLFYINRETYFNGTIDEVKVYNRSLSPTEIAEHYQGIYNDETGRVLYLDFDNNVNDHSGEGNNGAVNGDPEYSSGWANCPVSTSYNGTSGGTTVSLVNSTTGMLIGPLPSTAPTPPGNYTATVTVPAASANATVKGFIVDRYDVTLAAVDGTVSSGYPALLYATGGSFLGDHSLTNGDTVTIDTVAYTWSSVLSRFQRSVTQTTVGTRTYGSTITGTEQTYNITNFTVNTIHVTWIDGIKYAITNGMIFQAIWLILGASIGSEVAAGLIALGIMIPTYIMTDRIEYSAGLWILLGGVLETQLPGQVLGLGKVLFILGMAVFLWRLFIGGGRQHG